MCTWSSSPPKASKGEAIARKIVPSPAAKESRRQDRKSGRNSKLQSDPAAQIKNEGEKNRNGRPDRNTPTS